MKNTFVLFALVCTLVAQTQCSLTERLSAAGSKIATVKADAKAGKLDAKDNCKSACNTGGSSTCKNG